MNLDDVAILVRKLQDQISALNDTIADLTWKYEKLEHTFNAHYHALETDISTGYPTT